VEVGLEIRRGSEIGRRKTKRDIDVESASWSGSGKKAELESRNWEEKVGK
jgi:hypothetical protein